MCTEQSLESLERKVRIGIATTQEKVDFAWLAGQHGSSAQVAILWKLLGDEDEEVRLYSLESLVLDLGQRDSTILERCWQLLEKDKDEDVRSMATACIGSILFASNDLASFNHLKRLLQATSSGRLQENLYRTMLQLAGAPPLEWPGTLNRRHWSVEPSVDWTDVARVEDRIRAAQPR